VRISCEAANNRGGQVPRDAAVVNSARRARFNFRDGKSNRASAVSNNDWAKPDVAQPARRHRYMDEELQEALQHSSENRNDGGCGLEGFGHA
jgi:hypothetical protein